MNPDLDARQRARGAAVGLVLCASYVAMLAGAAFAQAWVVVAAVVVAQPLEVEAERSVYVRPLLRRAQMAPAARALLRDAAVLLLVAETSWARTRSVHIVERLVILVVLMRFVALIGHVVVRRRIPPLEVRNLDVAMTRASIPSQLYDDEVALRAHHLSFVTGLGVALAVATKTVAVGVVSAALTAVLFVVVLVMMVAHVVMSRRHPPNRYRGAVDKAVNALKPRLMLYFSGSADSTYQLNMWLTTLERLDEPVVVVLRERMHLDQMPATTLPIVCVPAATDFMAISWKTVRVAAYVANVGKNIHMLRERGVRHVFIGHGDSDKSGSFSPFSKVYSEIWVAGPAGRERYVRANVGVRADEVVEVGRPQLVGIDRGRDVVAASELVVLYAPTWEGWPGDPPHSSLVAAGERIVIGLLATPGVRLVYKPHPLTGTVSAEARSAHERIAARVSAAGAPHRVVTGRGKPLYDWFNEADVLVGDISSVISDFLASEKPYLMANLHNLPEEEFRDEFPSAGAAYLLGADGSGVEDAIASIRGGDPLAERRHRTREHLLGHADPGDIAPFATAVDAAAAAAEAVRAATGARSAAPAPRAGTVA